MLQRPNLISAVGEIGESMKRETESERPGTVKNRADDYLSSLPT
jgi:hypothetical protein